MPAPLRALAASKSSPARRAMRFSLAPATWSSPSAAGATGSRCTDGSVASPPGRFLQWKAVLHSGGVLGSVGVNYLPVNSAPVVDDLVVVPGARLNPQNLINPQNQTINITFPSANPEARRSPSTQASSQPLQANERPHRGHRPLGRARRRWRRPDLFSLPARRWRNRVAAAERQNHR